METVNILGTEYTVNKNAHEAELPEGCDGSTDFHTKEIRIENTDSEGYNKFILRHEIVHAFFRECGISQIDEAVEEALCDWLAVQGEKIMKAWKSVDAV